MCKAITYKASCRHTQLDPVKPQEFLVVRRIPEPMVITILGIVRTMRARECIGTSTFRSELRP